MIISSPLQTSSLTMMDDRSLRAYLQQNSSWNFEENGSMDYFNLASTGYGDKFLNNSVHFPSENLNQMVSNIFEEYQSDHQMKNNSFRSISESGYPRNIPDSSSTQYNPPKDIQVLIRKGDHMGINSLIRNVSLQQFRQMIGLQRSSGLTIMNDRKTRHQQSNSRLTNAFKQQINQKQYETFNDGNLPTGQEISYFRSNRRTGVANTLHIAIEKCYEQLNYIRDSYAEAESKIGIQVFHKSSSIIDITNTSFSSLSTNPSRVDRLIAEYQYEYNRIIRLHERIQEDVHIQDIEATRQTLDEWFHAIHVVQDRRRQEIDNASEKCLPDEKDVLQLAEALRILRITTRKIRTVLWYWLYWSTNSTSNKIPLIARYQNESDVQEMISLKKKSVLFNANNKENEYNE